MLNFLSRVFGSSRSVSRADIKTKYGIPDTINLSFEITDGKFIITSPDLPGFITQARDQKELLEMVDDAVLTYYDVPENEAVGVFNVIHIDGHGTIMSERAHPVLATR
ncbi:MAG: hypothetical protein AAB930_01165 [Patescibacteria group bacterium]